MEQIDTTNLPPLPTRIDSAKEFAVAITPSQYANDRKLALPDKLAAVATASRNIKIVAMHSSNNSKPFTVPIDAPLFEPFPHEINLQNFEPFQTYEVVLSFRNNDRFARHLKIMPIEHPAFSISGLKTNSLVTGKLATGIEAQFVLKFTPSDFIDYNCDIECVTERETFIVPVRASGPRAILDIADEITFKKCPVKYETTKTILLRNIGAAPSKFSFRTQEPFRVSPDSGYLAANECMQLDLIFFPQSCNTFTADLIVKYETGEETVTKVTASALSIDIHFQKDRVMFDHKFIGKNASSKVKIVNNSDIMVHYNWKRFESDEADAHYKKEKLDAIDSKFSKMLLNASQVADMPLLHQDQKNERRVVQEDLLTPESEAFTVEPINGVLWPHSTAEATVTFCPTQAGNIEDTFYCAIEGLESRLKLHLEAKLSRYTWNLGDVYLHTVHTTEFHIENRGDIPVPFEIDAPYSERYSIQFSPPSGIVEVNGREKIKCTFGPSIMGDIDAHFDIKICVIYLFTYYQGNPECLVFNIRGKTLGPQFAFDRTEIDYGKISRSFPAESELLIHNTSPIPMHYKLRPSNDVFKVRPSKACIQGNSTAKVKVICTPQSIGPITGKLWIDSKEISDSCGCVELSAVSYLPEIILDDSNVNYAKCYLTMPYHKKILFTNPTPFYGFLDVDGPMEVSNDEFDMSLTMASNIIEPNSTTTVDVRLVSRFIGHSNIPIKFKVRSSPLPPLTVDIHLEGSGPSVELSVKDIKLGRVNVLEPHVFPVRIKNTSPIPANVVSDIVNDKSTWSIKGGTCTLQAGQERDLVVTAVLTDTVKFTDILRVRVQHGPTYEIPLVATGIGSTIVCDKDMKEIHFGDIFSNQVHTKTVRIENKGKRSQTLHLSFSGILHLSQNVFEISPSRFTIKPGHEQTVTFKVKCKDTIVAQDTIVCMGTIDKEPARKLIFESKIIANVVTPSIEIDREQLSYRFVNDSSQAAENVLEQILNLQNTSSLPFVICFKCPAPFVIDEVRRIKLSPGEKKSLVVKFDPASQKDRQTTTLESCLIFSFDDNSFEKRVALVADTTYPDLHCSREDLEFRSVYPFSTSSEHLTLKNTGELAAQFKWMIERRESGIVFEDGTTADMSPSYFSVIPQSGSLLPGESMDVSVSFFSTVKGTFSTNLICKIDKGPVYRIGVNVVCSEISYEVSERRIDLGTMYYDEIAEKTVTLRNTGRIDIPLKMLYDDEDLFSRQKFLIRCSHDKLRPGETARVFIKYVPCFPGSAEDFVFVQIGYLPPIPISFQANVIFPQLHCDLPIAGDTTTEDDANFMKVKESIASVLFGFQEKQHTHWEELAKNKSMGRLEALNKKCPAFENQDIYLSAHVVDFGYAGRSQIRRKSFSVRNISQDPIVLRTDRTDIIEKGFTVDFDKPVTVKPGDSVTINVTLRTPKVCVTAELVKANLVLLLSHGVKLPICLMANVIPPSLALSRSMIDFQEIVVGQTKTCNLIMSNPSPVVCEWSLKTFGEKGKGKQADQNGKNSKSERVEELPSCVQIVPSYGVLQPGERASLTIKFSPTSPINLSSIISLRMLSSNDCVNISVKGEGIYPELTFANLLDFKDTAPYTEAVILPLQVTNNSKINVDIVSWESDDGQQQTSGETEERLQEKTPGAAAEPQSRSSLSIAENLQTIVFGPPLSGKTSLCMRISEEFGLNYFNIEDILNDLSESGTALGDKVKDELYRMKRATLEERLPDLISSEEINEGKSAVPDFDHSLLLQALDSYLQGLKKEEVSKMFIVDGIEFPYVKSPVSTLRILISAFENINPLSRFQFIHLSADASTLAHREKKQFEEYVSSQTQFTELSEQELEQMNDDQREEYENRVYLCRKKEERLHAKRQQEINEWRAPIRHSEELRKTRIAQKGPSKNERSSKRSATARSPSRFTINLDSKTDKPEADEEMSTDQGGVTILDLFEKEENYRHFERYSNSFETVAAFVKDGCRNEGKMTLTERRKLAAEKNRQVQTLPTVGENQVMGEAEEKHSTDTSVLLNEISSNEKTDVVFKQVADLLGLSSPVVAATSPVALEEAMTLESASEVSNGIKPCRYFKISSTSVPKTDKHWTIPTGQSVTLNVRYDPAEIGSFDEFLVFSVQGTSALYKVRCRAKTYCPMVDVSHKSVYAKVRKSATEKDFVSGEFVADLDRYDFGSLLVNRGKDQKSSDRHKAAFNLKNDTDVPLKFVFAFKTDVKSEVYHLDHNSAVIEPKSTFTLHVWAFPKALGTFDETIICCASGNPEPLLINLTCAGTKAELEVDKKQVVFEKVAVNRSDTRELNMRNPLRIPLYWKIAQSEQGLDDLLIVPSEGILAPEDKTTLTLTYKSSKPISFRKTVKLEVSEVEKQSIALLDIPIIVSAEVYEAVVDMTFNKGAESLDFGNVRIGEENKQNAFLKNRSKFDLGFRFVYNSPVVQDLLEITPSSGVVSINEKNTSVQFTMSSDKELSLSSIHGVTCEIFDLTHETVMVRIPVKVTAHVFQNSYLITPLNRLNMDCCTFGAKFSKQIFIENTGPFELKFTFCKPAASLGADHGTHKKKRAITTTRYSSQIIEKDKGSKKDGGKAESLSVGPFSISPMTLNVSPNSRAFAIVEFTPDLEGKYAENIVIDVADKDTGDTIELVNYTVMAEAQLPSIETGLAADIFPEATIVRQLDVWDGEYPVYSEDEQVLSFGPRPIGSKTSCIVRITNTKKIPCDMNFSIKPRHKTEENPFEIVPRTSKLGPLETVEVHLYFTASVIQSYTAFFEGIIENAPRDRSLKFEVKAECSVPMIKVLKTANDHVTVTQAKVSKTAIGDSKSLTFTIVNSGKVGASVSAEVCDEVGVFSLSENHRSFSLRPEETRDVQVKFEPTSDQLVSAELKVHVADNPFENKVVRLTGQGTNEPWIFTSMSGDDFPEFDFGDCFVGIPKTIIVKAKNAAKLQQKCSWMVSSGISVTPAVAILDPMETREFQASVTLEKPIKNFKTSIKFHFGANAVDSQETELSFAATASADFVAYKCDAEDVIFDETFVNEKTSKTLSLSNTGVNALSYEHKFFDSTGADITANAPFALVHSPKTVGVGQTAAIQVEFKPEKPGSYTNYTLVFLMANRKHDQLPLCIKLIGTAKPKPYHISLKKVHGIAASEDFCQCKFEKNETSIVIPCYITQKRVTRELLFTNFEAQSVMFELSKTSVEDDLSIERSFGSFPPGVSSIPISFDPSKWSKESTLLLDLKSINCKERVSVNLDLVKPKIYIDLSLMNFGPLRLKESKTKPLKVVNRESFPVKYSIDIPNLIRDKDLTFQVDSYQGICAPNTSVAHQVTFAPLFSEIFKSQIRVQFDSGLGEYVVKLQGEGYDIHEALVLETGGSKIELLEGAKSKNEVDFGRLLIGHQTSIDVRVMNHGKYPFDLNWTVDGLSSFFFAFEPKCAVVKPKGSVVCKIMFYPLKPLKLTKTFISCAINNEKVYSINCKGTASKTKLILSSEEAQFGSQFVDSDEGPAKEITITNGEDVPFKLDTLCTNSTVFPFILQSSILEAGASTTLSVRFRPGEAKEYKEEIRISVDDYTSYSIVLKGSGSPLSLSLVDHKGSRELAFGVLRVGQQGKKVVKVKNESQLPITFVVGSEEERRAMTAIGLKPDNNQVTLKPKEVTSLGFTFSPKTRLGMFKQEVNVLLGKKILAQFVLSGSCSGVEVILSDQSMRIGPIPPKTTATRNLLISNVGDLAAKFKWDQSRFGTVLSVEPAEGVISPNTDIPVRFMFTPRAPMDMVIDDLHCYIDGSKPLGISLRAICSNQVSYNDEIVFSSNIRQTEKKDIHLHNKTSKVWRLKPILVGKAFHAQEEVVLEPGETKTCAVYYSPTKVTTGDEKDEGYVLFDIPDGQSITYRLVGTADKPLPVESINRDVMCRTNHSEVLQVKNWMPKYQKLTVKAEMLSTDPSGSVSVADSLELSASSTKECVVQFYSHREGTFPVKLTLTNALTGEYIWYNLVFKSVVSDVVETIHITSVVRQKCVKVIQMRNPLDTPITMVVSCAHSEVSTVNTMVLPPKSETPLNVEFFPVQTGDSSTRLSCSSVELGTINYELKLVSKPAKPEKTLHYHCCLGVTQTQTVKFINYAKSKTEFTSKIDHPDFNCERSVIALASSNPTEVSIDLTYEPSKIGESSTLLTISSVICGDYQFLIHATCVPPQPQGPLTVKQSSPLTVQFKNVFNTAGTFAYNLDSTAFTVKGLETIQPKKTAQVTITFKGFLGSNSSLQKDKNAVAFKTGRLTITHTQSNTVWTYYLKGVQ